MKGIPLMNSTAAIVFVRRICPGQLWVLQLRCRHTSTVASTVPTARDYYIDHIYAHCKWYGDKSDSDPIVSALKHKTAVRKPWTKADFIGFKSLFEASMLQPSKADQFQRDLLTLRFLYAFQLDFVPLQWWDSLRDRLLPQTPRMNRQQFVTFAQLFQHRVMLPKGSSKVLQSKLEALMNAKPPPSIKDLGVVCYSYVRTDSVKLDSYELTAMLLDRTLKEIRPQENHMDYLPFTTILKLIRQSHLPSNRFRTTFRRLADECASRLPLNEGSVQLYTHIALICGINRVYSPALVKVIADHLESVLTTRSKDVVSLFSYLTKCNIDSSVVENLFPKVVKMVLSCSYSTAKPYQPVLLALSASKLKLYSRELWLHICRGDILRRCGSVVFLKEVLYVTDCNMAIDGVDFGVRLPLWCYKEGKFGQPLSTNIALPDVLIWFRKIITDCGYDGDTVAVGRVLPHFQIEDAFITWDLTKKQAIPADYLLKDEKFVKINRKDYICPTNQARLTFLPVPKSAEGNLSEIPYRLRQLKSLGYHTELIFTTRWREDEQSEKERLKRLITQFISKCLSQSSTQ